MTLQQIESQCRSKAEELLKKYFGNLVKEAAIEQPETIGDYSLELPRLIEVEYYDYLKGLWAEIAPSGSPTFEEIIDKKHLSDLMTVDDREIVKPAYDDAVTRTLWECLTKTNHKDVIYYKGLLKRYTEDLLAALRCDFMEDVKKTLFKNNKFYTPNPIDTSSVELDENLNQLVEQLARNVHENWAKGRINEGWTYGPERNDKLKQHPCLIDYYDLPDSEKEYDRNTAIETLKLIMKLGWKVEKEAYQKTQRDHATIEDYISYIKVYGNTSFNNGNSKKK
jgi:ryanodine receptor 2